MVKGLKKVAKGCGAVMASKRKVTKKPKQKKVA